MKTEKLILWTDLHSNLHHEDIADLPKWFDHARNLLDFWALAYYPYHMAKLPSMMEVEDFYPLAEVEADWEFIRKFANENNSDDFPFFMGFEWQGAGLDGDHNVFFKDNNATIKFPMRYQELYEEYKKSGAIAIAHHLAYQLGNRGKNWSTNVESFTPFVEVYSSHGSSENDYGSIPMNRHIHMGPRVGVNSVEAGLALGNCFGFIASGDNHSVCGVCEFGSMAVITDEKTKDKIWEAMIKRHVYGVSNEKIKLWYSINDRLMGSKTRFGKNDEVDIKVEGSNSLDRIEIIADNEVIEMLNCHKKRELPLDELVRFKFRVEFGWGPDRRVFPEIKLRHWHGVLQTSGKIVSVEKCWNSFGQKIIRQDDDNLEFELTTYKTTQTGKWMGTAGVATEGFIFEIETNINDEITLIVDGKDYIIKVRDVLNDSHLYSLDEEINELLYDKYNERDYYRRDTWWHNSYKFKVHKGSLSNEYLYETKLALDLSEYANVRVKVFQKNGSLAWSSPIFEEDR